MNFRIIFFISIALYANARAQVETVSTTRVKLPSYDHNSFKKLLQEVVIQQEHAGHAGRFVLKLTPYPESTLVLWGPLKGSYESLVRTLSYLHELGLIDDNLKIHKSTTYLVFNGDAITDAKTSLDTLMLIVTLMHKNPFQVIYIKGSAEQENQWQHNGLKMRLSRKVTHLAEAKRTFTLLLTRFFNTLPLALYVTDQKPQDGALRISYFPRASREINETPCQKVLTSTMLNTLQVCPLTAPQKAPLTIRASIIGEQRLMSYQKHPGLTLIEPENESVTWSIFSGPTPTYQREYEFFMDSFSLLKLGQTLDNAVISLYNRDMRSNDPITLRESFNLMLGTADKAPPSEKKKISSTISTDLLDTYHSIESLLSDVAHVTQSLEKKPGEGQ